METFSHFEIFNYAGSRVVEGHKVNINSEYEMKRDILYFALCFTDDRSHILFSVLASNNRALVLLHVMSL